MSSTRFTTHTLVLAILVSVPAFCAGHLLRSGATDRAIQVGVLSALTALVAAAIERNRARAD